YVELREGPDFRLADRVVTAEVVVERGDMPRSRDGSVAARRRALHVRARDAAGRSHLTEDVVVRAPTGRTGRAVVHRRGVVHARRKSDVLRERDMAGCGAV